MDQGGIKMKTLALLAAGLLTACPALADKPDWAGNGKGGKPEQVHKANPRDNREDRERNDARDENGQRDRQQAREHRDDRDGPRLGVYFGDRQRRAVHDYYADQYRRGHCPPGLAKKRNGCMPPGRAKQWRIGHALPRDVVYYDVPASIVVEFGAPPAMHRYVRIGADILLIAVGTAIVVDAIEDLGRM